MNITYSCPRCLRSTHSAFPHGCVELVCEHCQASTEVPADAVETGNLKRCMVCPCEDLFIRKMFPQRLGVAIVAIGFALSCVTWAYHNIYGTYAILFAVALIDGLLYLCLGNLLECYSCQAQYRDVPGLEKFQAFDLETHERHRQRKSREEQRQTSSPENPPDSNPVEN
jgi:hypothetical protein